MKIPNTDFSSTWQLNYGILVLFLMFFQGTLPPKGHGADGAEVWSVICMTTRVCLHSGLCLEALRARRTRKWPLARMDAQMLLQGGRVGERPRA